MATTHVIFGWFPAQDSLGPTAEIMKKAKLVVRGNHDDAIVSTEAAPWKARWRVTAEATRTYTAAVLSEEQKEYVRSLPLHTRAVRRNRR